MLRAVWTALQALGRAAVRGWGWTGFVVGITAGAVLALVAVQTAPRFAATGWEEGELVILSGVDETSGGVRDQLIKRWNEMGGGRPTARIEPVDGDTNKQRNEMVKRAQGHGAAVDIYNLDVILMEEFRRFDYIRPLDEQQVTDIEGFLPNPMRTCRDDSGRLWGLPFNTDAGLLYYRDDLAGDLKTLNSLGSLKEKIVDVLRSAPAGMAGYAGQLAEYEGLTVNAIEAIWAAGGQVVDEDGNVVVDGGQARHALKWLEENLRDTEPQIILPASRNLDEAGTAAAFERREVVFMRNWPVWYNDLKDKGIPVQVTTIPGRSVLGGQNLAIAANTDQPRAAQALIDFLTGELGQQLLFERGGLPATRASVYLDDEVTKKYPYARTLLTAINNADLRPRTPYYATFSEVFARGVIHALQNGGEPPPDFTRQLEDALRGTKKS